MTAHRLYERLRRSRRHPPLLIIGSGRSGTTWLLELVCSDPAYQMAFEPLHPERVPAATPWANRQPPDPERAPEARAFFTAVFQGALCTPWTLYRPWTVAGRRADISYRLRLGLYYLRLVRSCRAARQVAVKCIRANLFSHWFVEQFGASVLFVFRNPCQVVASWCRTGWFGEEAEASLAALLSLDGPPAALLAPHRDWLNSDLEQEEKMAVIWTVQNALPLSGPRLPGMVAVPYEFLLGYDRQDFARLFARLGKPCAFAGRYIRRRSSTSVAGNRTVDSRAGKRTREVLARFGFDLYTPAGQLNPESDLFRNWELDRLAPRAGL